MSEVSWKALAYLGAVSRHRNAATASLAGLQRTEATGFAVDQAAQRMDLRRTGGS